VGVLPTGWVLVIKDWIALTEVVAMATSTPLLTPQAVPVEENSLRPQRIEPEVLLSVALTAAVRAGHLPVQSVAPVAQFASAEVL
jgi:hypothetical protein